MRFRLLAASALPSLLGIAALQAQGTRALRDESIPRDLVEALLAGPGTPRMPTVVVGQLPTPMTGKVYVPAQARILGGMTNALGATVVFESSMRPQAIREEILREQAKLGWTTLNGDPMMVVALRRGGFMDAPNGVTLADGPTVPMAFCSGSTTLFVTIDPHNLVESRVTARFSADNGSCSFLARQAANMSSPTFRDPMSTFRWPVLVNPVGARSTYGGCEQMNYGGGGGENQISTSLTADQLFAHYGKQLADSGWKQTGELTMGRSWERSDSAGRQQQVSILIRTLAPGFDCRELSMQTRARY